MLRRFISRYGEEEELARLASENLTDSDGTEDETLFRRIKLDFAGCTYLTAPGSYSKWKGTAPTPRALRLANNGEVTSRRPTCPEFARVTKLSSPREGV